MTRHDPPKNLQTIYIGGGTPCSLPKEQLLRLVTEITTRYPDFEEFTIEVNPSQLNKETLTNLRKAGINRLSIGAQSFNQNELNLLGRDHSTDDITNAVKWARQAGFNNISLDLIFAIPDSTIKSWHHSLQAAINLTIEQISAYSLTYEPDTPLQQDIETGRLKPVDEETDRQMYLTAIDRLATVGIAQYEISNFAASGFPCKHNLRYWANKQYIGVGPAAGSYQLGQRTVNVANINEYVRRIKNNETTAAETETLTPLETACETAVLNLRRTCGIDLKEFKIRTGYDATELFAEPITQNKKAGLIKTENAKIALTRKAWPIADSILTDFAAI